MKKKNTKVFVICLAIGLVLTCVFYSIVFNRHVSHRDLVQRWHESEYIHRERAYVEYYDSGFDQDFPFKYYLENYYCYNCDPAVSNFAYFLRKSIFFPDILLPLSPLVASLLVAWIIVAVKKSNGKKAEKKAMFKSTFDDFD